MVVVSGNDVVFNSETAAYKKSVGLSYSSNSAQFYYMSSVMAQGSVLRITVTTSQEEGLDLSYIVVILLVLIGLIAIYGVFSCIRFCLRCRSGPAVQPAGVWSSDDDRAFQKILDESPEGKYDGKEGKFKQTSCAVCLAELEQDSVIRSLICSHIFHKICIETWIKAKIHDNPRCPICNLDLKKDRPPNANPPLQPPNQQPSFNIISQPQLQPRPPGEFVIVAHDDHNA